MRTTVRLVVGLGGQRWGRARARRQRGRLLQCKDQRSSAERTRSELDACSDRGIKSGIPGGCGMAPQRLAPGLQRLGRQHPPHGRGGEILHARLSAQLPRQFVAIPLGETAASDLGAFAGPAHHVDGHLRGTTRPWRRGQERPPAPRGAEPETASPTGGRRRVGRRPAAPPALARVGQLAAGSCVPGARALPPSWSTAASVAGSPAPRGITQGPKVLCGHAPSHYPPIERSHREDGRAARVVPVKQFWPVFYDDLY